MRVAPPRVFISYSHDSAEHKRWVLDFATTLRNRGIDAVLDQWDLKPGDDLPQFMEQNLVAADYAIMVCTSRYVKKANAGEGGAGYEKMIMTSSSLTKISANKTAHGVRDVMTDVAAPYDETSKDYILFSNLLRVTKLRQFTLEKYLDEALERGLIHRDNNAIHILEKGKSYLTENGIVDA